MDAIEHLTRWEHPSDYGGFSPDGDFLILSQHRDSSALDRSNYVCAFEELKRVAAQFPDVPEDYDDGREGWVYDFRAGHWAVGWVEYLLVRSDAPEEVLQAAADIVCSLADYPVLDEGHFSELEYSEAAAYWAGLSLRWRLDALKRSGSDASIFSIRHDEPPGGEEMYHYLRRD